MYLYVKAIHIIADISWFAGLFYLPRLLVYHTEAQQRPENERNILDAHFIKSEKLLFNAIMGPAMVLSVATGLAMLYLTPGWLEQGWLQIKLGFVLLLLHYHFYTRKLVLEVRKGVFRWTSIQLRLWNEWATILLVAIVFLVVLKSAFNWIWGVVGVIAFAVLIMMAVKFVNRNKRKAER
jgi:putative membrane protein